MNWQTITIRPGKYHGSHSAGATITLPENEAAGLLSGGADRIADLVAEGETERPYEHKPHVHQKYVTVEVLPRHAVNHEGRYHEAGSVFSCRSDLADKWLSGGGQTSGPSVKLA